MSSEDSEVGVDGVEGVEMVSALPEQSDYFPNFV